MDDLFQNPNDLMEVDPADLGPAFTAVLTSTLAKTLASEIGKSWTDKQESDMQEKISALVAAANGRGFKTIRVTVTRPIKGDRSIFQSTTKFPGKLSTQSIVKKRSQTTFIEA